MPRLPSETGSHPCPPATVRGAGAIAHNKVARWIATKSLILIFVYQHPWGEEDNKAFNKRKGNDFQAMFMPYTQCLFCLDLRLYLYFPWLYLALTPDQCGQNQPWENR
jgi:hypothetical protein